MGADRVAQAREETAAVVMTVMLGTVIVAVLMFVLVLKAVTVIVIVIATVTAFVIATVTVITAQIACGVHGIQDALITALPHIDNYQGRALASYSRAVTARRLTSTAWPARPCRTAV